VKGPLSLRSGPDFVAIPASCTGGKPLPPSFPCSAASAEKSARRRAAAALSAIFFHNGLFLIGFL
jgi:hypothetical protein